jgi:hypothetical protein
MMELIIGSGPSDEDLKKHVYLFKWDGYSQNENTLGTYKNVVESSTELLKYFHGKNATIKREGRYGNKKHENVLFIFLCYYYWNYFYGMLSGIFYFSTYYDGAPLRSMVLEKRVMLGVLP